MPGLTAKTLFNTSLAATSLGAALGFRGKPSDFSSDAEDKPLVPRTATGIGISAATTAGVLGGVYYAAARYKNPYLTPISMALAAGAGYVTARTYKGYQSQGGEIDEPEHPSLATKLLEGAAGLGALYYGGRALSPYVAKSVHRIDREARPWFQSFADTITQTTLENRSNFSSTFAENLKHAKEQYANAQGNFPLNRYLGLVGNIQDKVANEGIKGTAQQDAVSGMMERFGIKSPLQIINGMRQATLADAMAISPKGFHFPNSAKKYLIDTREMDASKISLGKGVLFDTVDKQIMNLAHLTPGGIADKAVPILEKQFGIPFLGNPLSFLRPNELRQVFKQGHQFQFFGPGEKLGKRLEAGPKGTVFAAGKLYDIETGKQIGSGGVLIKTGQAKTKANPLTGKLEAIPDTFEETAFGEILRKQRGAGMDRVAPEGFMSVGNAFVPIPKRDKWWRKVLNITEMNVPYLHDTGFAERESVFEKLGKPITEKAGVSGLLKELSESYKAMHETGMELPVKTPVRGRKGSFSAFQMDKGGSGWAYLPYSEIPETAAFWLTNRPTRLMEQLGLGNFDPRTTRNATDVIWKMTFKRFLPIYGAYKALQLTDDATRGLIGVGPLDLARGAVAHSITGLAAVRDFLGITDAAQYLENLMPGSMTASGPVGLRTFGLPLIGGAKFGPEGLVAGAAASLFLGGTGNITKTAEEKRAEYYGTKEVPIRSGRWWETGLDPFEGSKIKYFVPNWYRRQQSRYQYTSVQYGSAFEYWSNFFSPHHYAIKHYWDRPYPLATSGMEEIPLVGPAVAGIFSPPMLMHQDYMQNPGAYYGGVGEGLPGIPGPGGFMPGPGPVGTGGGMGTGAPDFVFSQPTQYGFQAGVPEQPAPYGVNPLIGGQPPQEAISPLSPKGRIGQEFYLTNEYLGMYGFMAHAIKQNITGSATLFGQPELESSSRITSAERSYWEQNIGGGLPFFETEFLRRFIPHRRHDVQLYNPIPNQMPSWMPGADYLTNFQIGDPYSKVDYGEIRLPGAGYEKFHTPGAGIVGAAQQLGAANQNTADGFGNYSILDRYRILGDIAPYSASFKYTQQYIGAMSKAGMLTPEGEEERKQIRKDVTAQKKRFNFRTEKFTAGDIADQQVTVDEYLGHGKFTVMGRRNHIYQLAGLKGITPEGEAHIASQLIPGSTVTVQALDDKRYRDKSTTVIPSTPVLMGGLNRSLVSSGEAEYRKVGPGDLYAPLNRKIEFNAAERLAGAGWEKFSHLNIPYFSNKFLHERTAQQEYERSYLYGSSSGDWAHPVRSFLYPMVEKLKGSSMVGGALSGAALGWMLTRGKVAKTLGLAGGAITGLALAAAGKAQGSNGVYIPEAKKQQWEIEQYFDTLKHIKYNRLYEYSRELAIQKQGIDPEELIRSVEASKNARHEVQKLADRRNTDLALELQQTTGNAHRAVLEERRKLAADTEFLHYQKYTEDEVLRDAQGGPLGAALKFHELAGSTMYGADLHGDFASLMRALPTKQREFFNSFITAPQEDRQKIASEVPLGMRRMLQAKWGEPVDAQPDLPSYFTKHFLPGENWVGWHPAVNLEDIKYKVVQNTSLDMHDFNLWPSQGQQIQRKPYIPLIDPFSSRGSKHLMKQELGDILRGAGYNNYELSIQDFAGNPGMSIGMDVKYATQPDAQDYINKHFHQIVNPSYV